MPGPGSTQRQLDVAACWSRVRHRRPAPM